ncbi:glycosyltransferase [Luteipulveratus mongoliensis]|uniref:Glycosyltransferase 2-like domain-containing protein n=1 Tax=Luteipulveratus mongoliensis TaxID=571913 RepID=A0A0K1JNC7_9MICO|nr:glycosyltransferase [Luteipulveratus mongoliensis]AKU18100.1 hypothetical protein VV02_23255 [Luteipulveratus mongoliensis]
MPRISLVTAVLADIDDYLADLYDSIAAQEMPDGWSWEWIVQEDGETGRPARHLPTDDPRVTFGTGPHARAAAARTLAMSRVTGKYTRALDADDMLTPGALARDISVLETEPVGWVVSPALDLFPDGSVVAGPRDPNTGRLPDRVMYDGEKAGLVPVIGTTVTAHTALVRAVGGWPAMPISEDVALLIALEAVAPGWMQPEASILYRKWPKQTTADKDVNAASDGGPARDVMLAQADTLRALGWRWTPATVPTAAEVS